MLLDPILLSLLLTPGKKDVSPFQLDQEKGVLYKVIESKFHNSKESSDRKLDTNVYKHITLNEAYSKNVSLEVK